MRPPVVEAVHPVPNRSARLLERLKRVLPDTLLFETAKEAFDDPILVRPVWGNELLVQPVVVARLAEAATLEDQAVVTPQDRGAGGPERAEALEARRFDRPGSPSRAPEAAACTAADAPTSASA